MSGKPINRNSAEKAGGDIPGVCHGSLSTSCSVVVGSPLGSLIVRRHQRTTVHNTRCVTCHIKTLFCIKVKINQRQDAIDLQLNSHNRFSTWISSAKIIAVS
jgi:hypothetical protein